MYTRDWVTMLYSRNGSTLQINRTLIKNKFNFKKEIGCPLQCQKLQQSMAMTTAITYGRPRCIRNTGQWFPQIVSDSADRVLQRETSIERRQARKPWSWDQSSSVRSPSLICFGLAQGFSNLRLATLVGGGGGRGLSGAV